MDRSEWPDARWLTQSPIARPFRFNVQRHAGFHFSRRQTHAIRHRVVERTVQRGVLLRHVRRKASCGLQLVLHIVSDVLELLTALRLGYRFVSHIRFTLADMRPAAETDRKERGDINITNATGA